MSEASPSPSLRSLRANVVAEELPEPVDTTPRDRDGFPLTARRRLKRVGELFEDIDTGQRFKARKSKDGTRLVPVFSGRVKWKTVDGFKVVKLLLSCMGREGEYKLWSKEKDAEMTSKEWIQMGMKNTSTPPIRHDICGEVVTTTQLNKLQTGGRAGCSCHNPHADANMWKNKYDFVVEMGVSGRFKVVTTREEWKRDCTDNRYCPSLQCIDCGEPVTTTRLTNLQQGQKGCSCHNNLADANMWVNKYDTVVEMGVSGRFKVITTREEWKRDCTNIKCCPTLQCLDCDKIVTTTCLANLQQDQGLGCGCRNKTEAKLAGWLRKNLPEAVVTPQFRGPGQGKSATHFDFHLRFPDGFQVIVEVDGAQHFWESDYRFDLDTCKRDLRKEEWSTIKQRNTSIIRLVQEDVWKDRYGWETFLMHSIGAARKVERARVFHPDAPEYTSMNSAYFQLRAEKRKRDAKVASDTDAGSSGESEDGPAPKLVRSM